MKIIIKIFAFIIAAGIFAQAHAKLATVGAVHDYVNKVWGIEIPHGATDSNLLNMRYLMQLVDAANEKLNGFQTSDFATNDKYATSKIAAVAAARQAVDELIGIGCPLDLTDAFCFVPATTSNTYSFQISAAGNYTIDWGDGQSDTIEKTDIALETYSHTYLNAASKHRIFLTGKATKYTDISTEATSAAITFNNDASRLRSIRGCLGCIFSTIEDESVPENQRQPRFFRTFRSNPALTGPIPEDLFKGVHGAPVSYMFRSVFNGCTSLTGSIPEKLFRDIEGAAATSMFQATFMNCNGLTGPSARIDGKYLYEIWPNSGASAYSGVTNLSDRACIPTSWGGAGTKKPGECEPVEEGAADADG